MSPPVFIIYYIFHIVYTDSASCIMINFITKIRNEQNFISSKFEIEPNNKISISIISISTFNCNM